MKIEYRKLCFGCPALCFADDGAFCGLGFTMQLEYLGEPRNRYRRYSADCKLTMLVLVGSTFRPKLIGQQIDENNDR